MTRRRGIGISDGRIRGPGAGGKKLRQPHDSWIMYEFGQMPTRDSLGQLDFFVSYVISSQ